jgi:hypothetical protein
MLLNPTLRAPSFGYKTTSGTPTVDYFISPITFPDPVVSRRMVDQRADAPWEFYPHRWPGWRGFDCFSDP